MATDHPATATMRGIAVVEALKGLIVIGAGFGALRLLHHDVRQVAVSLVTRLHIDPHGREAGLFVEAADHLTSARLWSFVGLAVAYAVVRFAEGYGLWFGRRWASWLGVIGGGIYVPVECYELASHPSAEKGVVLLVNLGLVAYLARQLVRQDRRLSPPKPTGEG